MRWRNNDVRALCSHGRPFRPEQATCGTGSAARSGAEIGSDPRRLAMIASRTAQTLFVDERFEEARSGATLPVVDPATGAITGAISAGDSADVDRAVRSAVGAFEGAWGA